MPITKPVHEVDDYGNDIHVDVDPYIPTGICGICSWEPPYVPESEPEPAPEPESEPELPVEETPAPETTEP